MLLFSEQRFVKLFSGETAQYRVYCVVQIITKGEST